MWRDMERLTEALDLKLVRPESFPANGLLAARIATALPDDGRRATFSKAVYTAEFADGADISDRGVLTAVLGSLGEDAEEVFALASLDATKGALRAATAEAEKSGVFGAPSLVTPDGELFWGNDRIEEALAWVNRHR
jgi:2-hydroxychromene-2-carboxylate isomerase